MEKQLKRMHEFLADQQLWRTNMGHALFMLENYGEAAKFYETVVRTQTTDLLKVLSDNCQVNKIHREVSQLIEWATVPLIDRLIDWIVQLLYRVFV